MATFPRALRLPLLLGLLFTGTAMATEEPPFKLVAGDGAFSVRDYPAMVVAEVTVSGTQDEASSAGEKIAMTAPVMQTGDGGQWSVRFVMPAGYTLQTLPKPRDARVKLLDVPPSRMAVVRFSGLANAPDVERQTALLREFVARKNFRIAGPASLARYNPPWTLWFMRRNEVMIALQSDD